MTVDTVGLDQAAVARKGSHQSGARIADWMSFELVEAPWLVRRILDPSGLPRPFRKLPKILFNNLHMLGRLPAWGVVRVAAPGREFVASTDLRNRQIIDTAKGFRDIGCYEPEVSLVLDRLLAGAKVFYDIGSNFGFYSLRATLNPAFTGQVHAFEISGRSFKDFCRLVVAAQLTDRILGHNVGLSDITGQQPFWEDQHSGRSKVLKSPRSKPTRVSRLDDYAIPPPDVMKVDVEGHEAAVFAGARRTIETARPAILFESWLGGESGDPFAQLAPLGYRFFQSSFVEGGLRLAQMSPGERALASRRINVLAVTERHLHLAR